VKFQQKLTAVTIKVKERLLCTSEHE